MNNGQNDPYRAYGAPAWRGEQQQPAPMVSVAPEFAPTKKSSAGKIALIVVAIVVAVCGGFSLVAVLAGGGSDAPAGTVSGAPTVRNPFKATAPTIKMTRCEQSQFGTVDIDYTLINGDKVAHSYAPKFDLIDSAGAKIGDGYDFVSEIAAGGTFKGTALGTVAQGSRVDKCVLKDW